MDEINLLEEYDKYVSSNKEVLSVLPINTKKNRSKYVEKVEELELKALKIKEVIWNEIVSRYNRLIKVDTNPKIEEIEKDIEKLNDIDFFNELNTSFEKLGLDKITHSLGCFFEGDLNLVNKNIGIFIKKFKEYGIDLNANDFEYSDSAHEYMKIFFEEYNFSEDKISDKLKKTFENLYWKCPDIVTHIELNMRYLYYRNAKKIEKELNQRNAEKLESLQLDKNGLVKRYFDLNSDLLKVQRRDQKEIMEKFENGTWKIKDFNDKEMQVLYDRITTVDYFNATPKEQDEINNNIGKLLNTLIEYNVYKKYKYVIDDLKVKYKNKESYKNSYELKNKELRKKENELLRESKKNAQLLRLSKNPLFKFLKNKIEKKIYGFPVISNNKIKDLKKMYLELDEESVNKKVYEYVDDNCSIKYMFKIAISYYIYLFKLTKKVTEDDDEEVIKNLDELIAFINQPYKVMVNNIKLAEEPDIISIISNRYKILNLKIEKEDLEENIESLIEDAQKIVDYNNIKKSGLEFDNIEFVEKVKPLINKK